MIRSKLEFALYASSLLAMIFILYENRFFITDDTYITFRYAEQFLRGHGLVYNPGDYVEGYTNFLFLLLMAGLKTLGLEYLTAARIVNLVCLSAIIVMVNRYLLRHRTDSLIAAMATVFLCASYPFLTWVMGGLEVILAAFFVVSATIIILEVSEKDKDWRWSFASGVCFALAYLTRPDMIILPAFALATLGGFMVWDYIQKRDVKQQFLTLLFVGMPIFLTVVVHVCWRLYYYEQWQPNTYYAKIWGIDSAALFTKGIHYVWSYLTAPPYLLFWVLVATPFALWQRQGTKGNAVLLAMIIGYILYILRAGGDWMPIFRFFVPIFPLVVILAGRSYLIEGRKAIIVAALVILHMSQITNNYIKYRPPLGNAVPHWEGVAQHINDYWPKDREIAINMSGYVPYRTPDHRYLDMLGLHDKHIARRIIPARNARRSPIGHMKGDGAYILEQAPHYIIVGSAFENSDISRPTNMSEREMLASPEFFEKYTKISVPIRVKRSPLAPLYEKYQYRDTQFIYYERKKI